MLLAFLFISLFFLMPIVIGGFDIEKSTEENSEDEKKSETLEILKGISTFIGVGVLIFFLFNAFMFLCTGARHKVATETTEQVIELKAFQDEEINNSNYKGYFFLTCGTVKSYAKEKYIITYISEVENGLFQRKTIEVENDNNIIYYNFNDIETQSLTIIYEYDVYEQSNYEKFMFPFIESDESGRSYSEKRIKKYIFTIPEGSIKYDNSINN